MVDGVALFLVHSFKLGTKVWTSLIGYTKCVASNLFVEGVKEENKMNKIYFKRNVFQALH